MNLSGYFTATFLIFDGPAAAEEDDTEEEDAEKDELGGVTICAGLE